MERLQDAPGELWGHFSQISLTGQEIMRLLIGSNFSAYRFSFFSAMNQRFSDVLVGHLNWDYEY